MIVPAYTIGFTRKTAAQFFELIRDAGVRSVLDVRRHNNSQLAGFAKKSDLSFFLREICGADYVSLLDLAPGAQMLKAYQSKDVSWQTYEHQYLESLARQGVERKLDASLFERGCLLCSEHEPHFCHRRLAIEYLNDCWGNSLSVTHLVGHSRSFAEERRGGARNSDRAMSGTTGN